LTIPQLGTGYINVIMVIYSEVQIVHFNSSFYNSCHSMSMAHVHQSCNSREFRLRTCLAVHVTFTAAHRSAVRCQLL